MAFTKIEKDSNAVLDYVFDWKALNNLSVGAVSDWLESGEVIVSHEILITGEDSALVKDSSLLSDSDTSVTVWLSGGTTGQRYNVTCRITTDLGRTEDETRTFKIKEK